MSDLSSSQRAVLELLAGSVRVNWGADDLLRGLGAHFATTQGATMTAASLVRRGYLTKTKARFDDFGGAIKVQVVYAISDQGRELVAALRSLDKTSARARI